MDSLNVQQQRFDWDNISVGCTHLDHSQNFFASKHLEHERFDEIEILQQNMVKAEISENKENILICSSPGEKPKGENVLITSPNVSNADKTVNLNKETPAAVKEKEGRQESCNKVTTNLACEWSTRKPKVICPKGAVPKNMPPPPRAYLAKDDYQRKREESARIRLEEEKKMREFHSRPAPSFNHHVLQQKRKPVHGVTVPITPQVLKKSRETEEQRRKKLEEWKQKNQPPKFQSRPAKVLKEKPFVPEKKPFVVQQNPFNLKTEKRLQERKRYDEVKQKSMEEKRKQEQEERGKLEKERIRELRKATVFKARPNPFKN